VKELSTHDSAPSEARKRGSGGGSPRKSDDPQAGPSDLSRKHQINQLHSSEGALYPRQRAERSEKRGSGGGSPRKSDDPQAGPSDLSGKHQINQLHSSDHDSAPSEARKRGSGGGSPKKSGLSYRWLYNRTVDILELSTRGCQKRKLKGKLSCN
jgi:hypothetical protein